MPRQIAFIIGNEGCERFSFYGMRSILTVFMSSATVLSATNATRGLGMTEPNAKAIYHLFVAACYLFPLLGGFIADRFWGRYKTILYISLFYCAGHGVLAAMESRTGLWIGLSLIAFGAGGIKPCVSAFVGDQFTEQNKSLVEKVYSLFYWIINFGSFFSNLLIPYLREHHGNAVAFGLPGILMAIATLVFWLGRGTYHRVAASRGEPGAFAVIGHALSRLRAGARGASWLDLANDRFGQDRVESVRAALRVGRLFVTISVFWALFDQHGSSWVLQARTMVRDVHFFGRHVRISPSQMSAANPAIVMLLIPTFSFALFPLLRRLGLKVSPLGRMSAGMFIAGLSFVAVAVIQFALDRGVRLSILWQLVPYVILTAAEVLISVTGLEFAYTQAPRSMKSTLMSFWLLTVFAGNLLTAAVEKMNPFGAAPGFLFYAGLMFAVAIVFAWQASRFVMKSYMESDESGAA